MSGLRVDERRIAENLRTYGPFAGTEAVLMEAAQGRRRPPGAARSDSRERDDGVRGARARRRRIRSRGCIADDERIARYVDPAEIRAQLDPSGHTGDAPQRARRLAAAHPTKRWRQVPVNKGHEITRGKTKVLLRISGPARRARRVAARRDQRARR